MSATVGQEAKRRLAVNIGTNILAIVVTTLIQLWFTPYLIRHLGVALYGMVPLAASVAHYCELFTIAISTSVSRFVLLYADRHELDRANAYFSTAFYSLLALCVLLLVPTIVIATLSSRLFQVPSGYERQVGILFFLLISSSFIWALSSPFGASTLIKHRFDLRNLSKILTKLVQIAIVVLCFTLFSASLSYVGLSALGMALLATFLAVVFARYLTPEWRLRKAAVSFRAFRDMAKMGTWVTIAQIGALLYLNIDLVVINIFLGALATGHYAPFTVLVIMLSSLGDAIASVFAPIALEYTAKNDMQGLARQTCRALRFIGIAMALPIGVLCGLSEPFLRWWLGDEFAKLSLLIWLLVGHGIVDIVIRPLFHTNTALNKVKFPAIATIIGGCVNLVGAIVLVRYTPLGLYGVAVATVFSLLGKNLIFQPIYSAVIMGQRNTLFYRGLSPGFFIFALIALAMFGLSRIYDLATLPRLIGAGTAACLLYVATCYGLVMSKEDRAFLSSMFARWRTESGG